MNNRNIVYLCSCGLGLVFAALLGCSGSAAGDGVAVVDQKRSERQVPPTVQGAAADTAQNAVLASTAEDNDNGQPDAIHGKTEEALPEYEWPNPDRSEIFLPPANKPASAAVEKRNDYGVALIGFANVGRKQVLLEIDGIIAPLTVGDTRGELQVLAIDPPEVTLKRRGRQWTIKLFDTPD